MDSEPSNSTAQPARCLKEVRVLVLFGGIAMHGSERANLEVFRTMAALGLKCWFLTHRRWGHLKIQPELDRLGFEWTAVPFGPNLSRNLLGLDFFRLLWGLLATNWSFWRELRRWRPTHLYTPDARYVFYCAPAIFFSRLPLIYRLGDSPSVHNIIQRIVWRIACRRTSFFVCISQFIGAKLKKCAIGNKASVVIYNYPPARNPAPPMTLPESFAGAVNILYMGQIRENKGVPELIAAARLLLAERRNIVVWLAGDYSWRNPMAEQLMKELRRDGLERRIQFLGYVDDIPSLLRRAHIHVCPSVYEEPLSNVILEAKAHGVPSVGFPTGGIPEIIEHPVDGYLCAETTAEALAGGIAYFLNDPGARERAGLAARQSLDTKFGQKRFQREWADVFLMNHRAGTSTGAS